MCRLINSNAGPGLSAAGQVPATARVLAVADGDQVWEAGVGFFYMVGLVVHQQNLRALVLWEIVLRAWNLLYVWQVRFFRGRAGFSRRCPEGQG